MLTRLTKLSLRSISDSRQGMKKSETSPKIIIGVPGPWPTRSDIVTSIAQLSGGFLFAGMILLDTKTNQGYTLEIHEHDPHLQQAFRLAGGGRIADSDIVAIGEHRHTLYCLTDTLSVESALQMLRVGTALLNAGGIAVKVESSGVAHSAQRWRELALSESLFDTHIAFVPLIGGKDSFYSCGMHNFGLPDAAVPRDLDPRDAAKILNIFNHYLLGERPTLEDGHTFSIAADAPRFRLHKTACDTYPCGH